MRGTGYMQLKHRITTAAVVDCFSLKEVQLSSSDGWCDITDYTFSNHDISVHIIDTYIHTGRCIIMYELATCACACIAT